MVAVTTPMPLVVQIVPTRDKGGITKTRETKVTREVVTMAPMEGVEVSRGEDTTLCLPLVFEQIFSLIIGIFWGHLIVYFSTVVKLNIIDYSRAIFFVIIAW